MQAGDEPLQHKLTNSISNKGELPDQWKESICCITNPILGNTGEMQKVREALSNLGAAKNILGLRVERFKNVITLDQSYYIRNVLDGFNMQDRKPACTPLATETQLEKGVCDTSFPFKV
jgi:hypothetical protein